MFLTACRAVAKEYPKIKYSEDLLDRVCLRIATDPAPFEKNVMVMPNLSVGLNSSLSSADVSEGTEISCPIFRRD